MRDISSHSLLELPIPTPPLSVYQPPPLSTIPRPSLSSNPPCLPSLPPLACGLLTCEMRTSLRTCLSRCRLSCAFCGVSSPHATRSSPLAAVNIIGSAMLGGLTVTHPAAKHKQRLLLGTGFCGGFTTFSAFAMDTMALIQEGRLLTVGSADVHSTPSHLVLPYHPTPLN